MFQSPRNEFPAYLSSDLDPLLSSPGRLLLGRLVPIRLGAKGLGEVIDEYARLGRKIAPVRVDRIDGDVGAKIKSRQQAHQRAILELLAHVPGGLERDSEAGHRPFAQHFPVVA